MARSLFLLALVAAVSALAPTPLKAARASVALPTKIAAATAAVGTAFSQAQFAVAAGQSEGTGLIFGSSLFRPASSFPSKFLMSWVRRVSRRSGDARQKAVGDPFFSCAPLPRCGYFVLECSLSWVSGLFARKMRRSTRRKQSGVDDPREFVAFSFVFLTFFSFYYTWAKDQPDSNSDFFSEYDDRRL